MIHIFSIEKRGESKGEKVGVCSSSHALFTNKSLLPKKGGKEKRSCIYDSMRPQPLDLFV